MNVRKGVFRLTAVLWGTGSAAVLALAVAVDGNPLGRRHPERVERPPTIDAGVCDEAEWSDERGNALRVLAEGPGDPEPAGTIRSAADAALERLLRRRDHGPTIEPEHVSLGEGVVVAFRGELWRRAGGPVLDLPDRFQIEFESLARCGAFWHAQSLAAREAWDADAQWALQEPGARSFWFWVVAGVAAWTALVWSFFGLFLWIAKGFKT